MTLGPELAARLKLHMIRHTKSQRIGGEVALALPEADCDTIFLDMSFEERSAYVRRQAAAAGAQAQCRVPTPAPLLPAPRPHARDRSPAPRRGR